MQRLHHLSPSNRFQNFVVLMIVRLANEERIEASVTTYLPDGTIGASTLLLGETIEGLS